MYKYDFLILIVNLMLMASNQNLTYYQVNRYEIHQIKSNLSF